MNVKVEKDKDIKPVCPFCEAKLEKLVLVDTGWFSTHRVYCCPKCRKVLGTGYNM